MRILAIDLQQSISSLFAEGLAQEGFLIDKISGMQKGVWMAKTNYYDLVILSIPSFKVLTDTVSQLSSDRPSVFLIVLLADSTLERRITLFESGADEIITCPCSFRELVIKIRNLLRREKGNDHKFSHLKIDDLVVSMGDFTVRRGAEEITLRRKEFDLLHFLLCNQGRVIPRTSILEGVWDSNADMLTNTLEVHILSLRRKIDFNCPKERRLIHTVYGRGYLFGLRPTLSAFTPTRTSLVSS